MARAANFSKIKEMRNRWCLSVLVFAVMSSTNYAIQSDAVGVGATSTGSSAEYIMQSTIGETGTGRSSSSNYRLLAGFRQMAQGSISTSVPASVDLGEIDLATGGQATKEVSITISHPNSGYSLSVRTPSGGLLRTVGVGGFEDYNGITFGWSVPSTRAMFGFSPEGSDIASDFLDNAISCGTGSTETSDSCWDGFSATPATIALDTATSSSSVTVLKLRAEIGANETFNEGSYSTTIETSATPI